MEREGRREAGPAGPQLAGENCLPRPVAALAQGRIESEKALGRTKAPPFREGCSTGSNVVIKMLCKKKDSQDWAEVDGTASHPWPLAWPLLHVS